MKNTLLIIIFIVSLFLGLNSPPWDQDEAAYFGFSWTMLIENQYIVPDFPYSFSHRKTPLHFWVGAAFYKIFGEKNFSFRLYTILSFLITIGIVYYFFINFLPSRLSKLISKKVTLVFASGFFLPIYSKIALTDIPLLMYSLGAITSFWMVISKNGSFPFLHVLAFWIFIGLGVLQKGPPILILVCGIALFIFIFSPKRKNLIRLHPWFFLPLSLIPLLVWGRLAWLETSGEFIHWLVDWYILRRAGGSVFGQSGPPGYYLVLLFFLLYPWSLFLPNVIHGWVKYFPFKNLKLNFSLRKAFVLGWFFSSYLFYELVPSKLPSYILTSLPLFSFWIAFYAFFKKPKLSKVSNILFIIVSLSFLCLLLLVPILFGSDANLKSLLISTGLVVVMLIVFIAFLKAYYAFSVLVLFHLYFSLLFYPMLDSPRNYGAKLVSVIQNQQWNQVFLHESIQLPSIPLALVRQGVPREKIETIANLQDLVNLRKMDIFLANKEWKDLLESYYSMKTIVCHDFYSYESGKYLSLCWFSP